MPKQKRHSSAKKRFRVTGTGKLLRRRANRTTPPGHLVSRPAAKRKRARGPRPVAPSDEKTIKKLLGRG